MDIELEKLKKLEHALHDAIDILRDWQVEEAKPEEEKCELLGIIQDKDEAIADLQKENAELTCQVKRNIYCYSCAKADERCFRKEIGCPCGKYKSYKDENVELKSIADFQTSSNMDRYFELKRKKEQLTNAKEIIKELLDFDFLPENELKKQAEQFLYSEAKEC